MNLNSFPILPLLLAILVAPDDRLGEVQVTEHFHVRYRAGSRAGASVDRHAHLLELEYAEILSELGIAGRVDESESFRIFLYDDLAELKEITGVSGTGGYSAGRESHIPRDNDQTRKHELVHIVVAAMEPTGEEARNMFFAEGIANAVLEFVHGIPVHSVAAYERQRGSLPELRTLVEHPDFYAFLSANPGLNAYDVGGSFFLYLLETYKPRKVMEYYHGKPIRKALGKSLEKVEQGWHARLDAFPLRPELATLLSQRRGDGGEFTKLSPPEKNLPAELLGEPGSWTSVLADLSPQDEIATWQIGPGSIAGENPSGSDWSHLELPGRRFGDCALRLKARTGESCWGVKIRYGGDCEAILLGQGAFIYTPRGGIAHSPSSRLKADSAVDLILVVRENHAWVYVDESLLLEADLPLEPAFIGLGLVGGKATFEELAVREL